MLTRLTPADLSMLSRAIRNIVGRKKMLFSMLFISSVNSNIDV
jgi:hypothetical protein